MNSDYYVVIYYYGYFTLALYDKLMTSKAAS